MPHGHASNPLITHVRRPLIHDLGRLLRVPGVQHGALVPRVEIVGHAGWGVGSLGMPPLLPLSQEDDENESDDGGEHEDAADGDAGDGAFSESSMVRVRRRRGGGRGGGEGLVEREELS